jgi:hypothetical protein
LPLSVSSRWWGKGHQLDEKAGVVVLKVGNEGPGFDDKPCGSFCWGDDNPCLVCLFRYRTDPAAEAVATRWATR